MNRMKKKRFPHGYYLRKNNTLNKSNQIEKDYLKQAKQSLRFAIENEIIYQVEEIISTNKFIINQSTTSFVQNSHSCSPKSKAPIPIEITNDYVSLNSSVSNILSTSFIEDKTQSNSSKRSASSSLSVKSSDSVKKTKKIKIIKRINWSTFYIDKEGKDNALHYACRLGKTCLIDVLLESGYFCVNEKNSSPEQDTPLCIACDSGWLDTAKLLIARGANVNFENSKSKTCLILSTELIYPYDTQMCKLLLSSRALVNLKTKTGNTALLSASKFGNIELINLLLQANSNINCQFSDGATALMRACYYNYPELVDFLLDQGADVETRNLRKETALYIASFRGNLDIVRILVDKFKADVNSQDIDGDTPLAVACYEEKTKVISYLLNNGSQVNKKGIRGDSPLHIAVANCNNNVVVELLEHGANPDALNNENETPLHIVIRHNRCEILQTLLSVCKSLDQCSLFGNRTAFKYLIENLTVDKIKMALLLIKAGCDVNKSFSGTTINTENIRLVFLHSHFDSPFEFIFRLSKSKFKFYQQMSYFGAPSQNQEDQLSNAAIGLLVNLVVLVIEAGYRISLADYKLFQDSWLFNHLATNDLNTFNYVNSIFLSCLNGPNSLANLCRIRIRSILNKPIETSISMLNIPKQLKSFIYFD